ncbi:hypothetical protein V8E54_011804 [Elaphomyces granulatus]
MRVHMSANPVTEGPRAATWLNPMSSRIDGIPLVSIGKKMRPEDDRQCLMRFVSLPLSLHGQTSIKLNSTITLGSSEDVSFTAELDRAALSRIGVRISREYGREKQGMPWTAPTITTIEKTQGPRHHSDPLEAPRQVGGEKAPCVHNKPVIGIRLPASVREDNHDIPPCTLEPPLLLSEEILMLRFIRLGPWPRNLE